MHQKVDTTPTDQQRIDHLLNFCTGISAPAAYNLIETLCGSSEVIWPIKGTTRRYLKTFVDQDEVNWCMAHQVHFKFWGGPPTKLGYYNGSLETLLKDRVLDFIHTHGLAYTETRLNITPLEVQKCLPF